MNIQIRISIDVPDKEEERLSYLIEKISELIFQFFPRLKKSPLASPVRVSITHLDDAA